MIDAPEEPTVIEATKKPTVVDAQIKQAMFAALPHLRAFAISLSGNIDRADDLVQETLLRALTHIHHFERGTNLQAWLFTILRNLFHSDYRKRRREVEDPDGIMASKVAVMPEQGAKLDFDDLRLAMAKLSPEQREALVLVGAEGLTYEEAAQICNTHIGTIKSRVNRARNRLAQLLGLDEAEDVGADRIARAVLQVPYHAVSQPAA